MTYGKPRNHEGFETLEEPVLQSGPETLSQRSTKFSRNFVCRRVGLGGPGTTRVEGVPHAGASDTGVKLVGFDTSENKLLAFRKLSCNALVGSNERFVSVVKSRQAVKIIRHL